MYDKITEIIKRVAEENDLEINEIKPEHTVVDDLGFASIEVALLTAEFEEVFGINPFVSGMASIMDIRTVQDVTNLYTRGLAEKEASSESA